MMIHWHEGMHLLPHHLQALQRWFAESLAEERLRWAGLPGGFLKLDLVFSKDEVGVRELKAVTPRGVLLDYPHNVVIPSCDIAAELARRPKGFPLRLGLPLWNSKGANSVGLEELTTQQRPRQYYRYFIEEANIADENVKENETRTVFIRKYNARLLLEDDPSAEMDILPLGRVKPLGDLQAAELDPTVCPPILRVRAWRPLRDLLEELVRSLENAVGNLTGRIGDGGFSLDDLHGSQPGLVLRLRTVNHFAARLKVLVASEQASPLQVFAELSALCGELVALSPLKESGDFEVYSPEAPYDGFKRVTDKIRRNLEVGEGLPIPPVPFEPADELGDYQALLPLALQDPGKIVHLVIETESSREDVRTIVGSGAFKLGPALWLNRRGYSGVAVRPVSAPRGYPGNSRLKYFEVEFKDLLDHLADAEKEATLSSDRGYEEEEKPQPRTGGLVGLCCRPGKDQPVLKAPTTFGLLLA